MAPVNRKIRRQRETDAHLPASAPRATGSAYSLDILPEAIGYALRRAQLTVYADFIAALEELDLRPSQFGVLVIVDANPGLSQRDVCELLGLKQANLVTMLHELANRGLTERRESARDQRSRALHLTAKGHELLQRARSAWKKHEERIIRRLGPENRELLLGLLQRLGS
jgi:DNA-binding MarR family transcriptional regulator